MIIIIMKSEWRFTLAEGILHSPSNQGEPRPPGFNQVTFTFYSHFFLQLSLSNLILYFRTLTFYSKCVDNFHFLISFFCVTTFTFYSQFVYNFHFSPKRIPITSVIVRTPSLYSSPPSMLIPISADTPTSTDIIISIIINININMVIIVAMTVMIKLLQIINISPRNIIMMTNGH